MDFEKEIQNTVEMYKIKNETTKCNVLPWVESWSRKRNQWENR